MSSRVLQCPQDDYERDKISTLKEFFNLSISDYELICACDRDSENPWGVRNDRATPAQRKVLKRLQERRLVIYNAKTQSYELDRMGSLLVRADEA